MDEEDTCSVSIEDLCTDQGPVPKWMPDIVMNIPDHKCELTQLYKVFTHMHQLQRDNIFCDITIQVNGSTFHAHKIVLASSSDFFAAMLKSDFKESHESKATISGTPEAFQTLLDFAYSGKLSLSLETVIDVMEMAHYLQFEAVMHSCVSFLRAELDERRADAALGLRILSSALVYDLRWLKGRCKRYLAENFEASDTFVSQIPGDLMVELIDRSDLKDEKKVR